MEVDNMVHLGFDYGHGEKAANRIPTSMGVGNISEFSINKADGECARKYLLDNYEGVQVTVLNDITGATDTPLIERTNKANSLKVTAVISFHHDAGGGTGITVFRYNGQNSGTTYSLGKAIVDELLVSPGNKGNRYSNYREENFHMLRETDMPAILIENGFMDNIVDAKKIVDPAYQRKTGEAVAKAIAKIYGLKKKELPKPTPPPVQSNVLHRVIAGSYSDRANADAQVAKLKKAGFDSFIEVKNK